MKGENNMIKFLRIGLLFLLFLTFTFFILVPKTNNFLEEQKVEEFIATPLVEEQNDDVYIGVLEIPSIKLKRGFYALTSKNNKVSKNIQMIETSVMPNVLFGNLILASHSGSSNISFFKNLDKLKMNAMAFVYYHNQKFQYVLVDKYNEEKDGNILVKRKKSQTNLTLITCDKKDQTAQTVYVFKQIND